MTAPRTVGDAVAYGLAVAVVRGLGDAAAGRGEAVDAGDVPLRLGRDRNNCRTHNGERCFEEKGRFHKR